MELFITRCTPQVILEQMKQALRSLLAVEKVFYCDQEVFVHSVFDVQSGQEVESPTLLAMLSVAFHAWDINIAES